MFDSLKRAHRFARMGALWMRVTGLDLRDGGQIARVASRRMVDNALEPEEAWLSALVGWTAGMPWAEDQQRIAECIVSFSRDLRVTCSVPRSALEDARASAIGLLNDLMQEDRESDW